MADTPTQRHAFLAGGGEMGARMRVHDWRPTPLGAPDGWPEALRTMVSVVLNSALLGAVLWGPELRLLYNDAYAPALAERHPDALGRPLAEVWADIWDLIAPSFLRVLHTAEPHFEVRFPLPMTRGGESITTYWNYSVAPIRDGSGEIVGLLNQALEITAEVQAEAELRASERHLDALIRSSSNMRYSMNADWSELQQLAGGDVPPGLNASTRDWLEAYIPAEDRDRVRAEIARVVSTGADYALEHRIIDEDGTIGWVFSRAVPLRDDGGRITGWLGAATNITDRKRAQDLLEGHNLTLGQQVEERSNELRLYRDIVQSDAAPILAFDRDYRLIGFNRAHADDFRPIIGHRQEIGEVLPDLFPPDQAKAMKGFMDRALAGERFTVTSAFGDPERALPTWEITYTPLRDAAGSIVGAFHHARNVSERVRADLELATTQDALRQSQKMEAVGQLTGGVAHDFNNLLTVIKSSTDLLKRPNLSEERRTRYISAISDTVDRAAKLTGQLLAFARRQALKPEVFDACDSVRALSDMVGTLTGSRISVTSDLPEEPCFVLADPSQFDTALVNMAVNARDAMDGAGQLILTVQAVDELPTRRSHAAVLTPHVSVSLADTGSGIAPDQLDRIFEPFFTTKGVGKGTGLGLSQVFGFAKQSGGDILVSSKLGEGTTFTLYLPRVAAPEPRDADAEPEAVADGHGVRVLVVEDNLEVGTFAVQTLSDLGYETVFAPDGEAALAELAKDADRFDVVFTDVMMPGMSGIELGQEIRRRHPNLPVVLTSGYSHVLAQTGPSGFGLLHKPYSVEQLSQVLRKAVSRQPRNWMLAHRI